MWSVSEGRSFTCLLTTCALPSTCSPGENPMQMLLLQQELQERLGGHQPMDTILLLERVAGQRVTGLNFDYIQMEHTVKTFLKVAGLDSALRVEVFSDGNKELLNSVKDTGKLFNRAKLMIAKHGAAESNILFMQPGSMVFELWDYG